MTRIRWKLLAAMLAIVVVTVAIAASFTRTFTHEQVRRLMAKDEFPPATMLQPLAGDYRAHGNWSGVQPVIDRIAKSSGHEIALFDASNRVITTSDGVRNCTVTVEGGVVHVRSMEPGRTMNLLLHVPPMPVSGTNAHAYILPPRNAVSDESREFALVDRRLLITFAIAAAIAVLLTWLMSRQITRPLEELTAAVHDVARGVTPTRVRVKGRDEIAQLAMSFNVMAESLATQETLRQRMVGDVAHELRTPLTNLRCELEAIQDGLTTAEPSRIASLHEEVLHLQRLVEDLQDLAVAEAGGLSLQRERIDLRTIVERVVDSMRSQATIDVRAAEETCVVDADPLRIAQIIRNLLQNAIDHTSPDGHVCVNVSRGETNAVVSVKDSGVGIPEGELDRIFERFYRVDESRSRASGGAGLGLAIVRSLVDLHGGRVWAESARGRGATFTFTIPLAS